MRCLINFLVLESAIADLAGSFLDGDANDLPAVDAMGGNSLVNMGASAVDLMQPGSSLNGSASQTLSGSFAGVAQPVAGLADPVADVAADDGANGAEAAPGTKSLDQLQIYPVRSKKDMVDLNNAGDLNNVADPRADASDARVDALGLDPNAAEGLGAFVQASELATVYGAPLGLLDVPFLAVNGTSTQAVMQVMTAEKHEQTSSRDSAGGIGMAAAAGGVAILGAGAFAVQNRMKRRRAQNELSRFGSPHRNGSSELPRRFLPV